MKMMTSAIKGSLISSSKYPAVEYVLKTNLNSCDVMFRFWNIWTNNFQDKFSTP